MPPAPLARNTARYRFTVPIGTPNALDTSRARTTPLSTITQFPPQPIFQSALANTGPDQEV